MKYYWRFIKLFCVGFILAGILNLYFNCSKEESPTQASDQEPSETEYIENQDMKNLSDSLISAFKSEDKSKVLSCLNNEFEDIYSSVLNNTTVSLSEFGSALEERKLIFSNSLYAEYEITINENTYTIAYANCGDSNWQLVRL